MKKIILLGLSILCFSYSSLGQFGDISSKQLAVLKNSKLLVVKSGSDVLDSLVQYSMEESWDFIPYEIVSHEEAKNHYGDEKYSFLTFVSYDAYSEGKWIKFTNLVLLLTNKKDKKKNKLNFVGNKLAYLLLDNSRSWKEEGDQTFFYKWNDLFKGFTNFLKLADSNGGMSLRDLGKHYMKNKEELKSHTLLIEPSQLNREMKEDTSLLAEVYLFEYELVSHAAIYSAIKDVNADYAYVYSAPASSRNFTMIIECGTGRILLIDMAGSYAGAVPNKLYPRFIKILMANFR